MRMLLMTNLSAVRFRHYSTTETVKSEKYNKISYATNLLPTYCRVFFRFSAKGQISGNLSVIFYAVPSFSGLIRIAIIPYHHGV